MVSKNNTRQSKLSKSQKRNKRRRLSKKAQPMKRRGGQLNNQRVKSIALRSSPWLFKPTRSHSAGFEILIKSIKGNSSGKVVFGCDIDHKEMKGLINTYQKFRITWFGAKFVTEAAATDRGCIAYHIDTGNSMNATDVSVDTTWGVRTNGTMAWGKQFIGDKEFYEFNENQFTFLYSGSGENVTVGHLKLYCNIIVMNYRK